MKKILSLILSIVMLMSLSVVAFAAEEDSKFPTAKDSSAIYISCYNCPPQYVSFASEKIGAFLESSEFSGLTSCYLGNPFTFANINSNVYYFPVFHSGIVICILRVYSNEQGDIFGVLSKGFSDELNSISASTSADDPLYIYLDGEDIIFKTCSIEEKVLSCYDNQNTDNLLSVENASQRIITECSVETSHRISNSPVPFRSSIGNRYLNIFEPTGFPLETQGQNSWCAAYASAAILRYKGVSGLYAENILEYFYGSNPSSQSTLSDDQIYSYATALGFYTVKTNSTLTSTQLCNEIDNDRPVYIVSRRPNNTPGEEDHLYHALVLCGYNDITATFRIWNPWYTCYETVSSLYNYVPYRAQAYHYEYVRTIYHWSQS